MRSGAAHWVPRSVATLLTLVMLGPLASCSSDDDEKAEPASSTAVTSGQVVRTTDLSGGATTTGPGEGGAAGGADATDPLKAVPPVSLAGDRAKDCPSAFVDESPAEGLNEGFESAGQSRSFHLLLPAGEFEGPRPLFLALTGTVQEERSFLTQSQLDQLPADGWIVVAPVRNDNGILWPPWDAMRTPPIADQPNPDQQFFVDLIRCVGAHKDVDAARIYVGGISIGGTMVNYLLQRESELFAGGIVGSGNFVTTQPNEPEKSDDMIVVVAWGGDNDRWSGCADGTMGNAAEQSESSGGNCVGGISFVEDASRASIFWDSEENVQQVACHMELGHIWLTPATEYMVAALLAHPKGLPGQYVLPEASELPDGLECMTEPFILEK